MYFFNLRVAALAAGVLSCSTSLCWFLASSLFAKRRDHIISLFGELSTRIYSATDFSKDHLLEKPKLYSCEASPKSLRC